MPNHNPNGYNQFEKDESSKCGTELGYQRHWRKKEKTCSPCKIAHSAYRKNYYIPKQKEDLCGSDAGYQRHIRKKENACNPCRDAHNVSVQSNRENARVGRCKTCGQYLCLCDEEL